MEQKGNYIERIHRALQTIAADQSTDPMADCAAALSHEGMKHTLTRMPLSEAVWHAHLDSPIIVWSEPEQKFIIVLQAGSFRVRIIQQGDPVDHCTITSRAGLAKMLGIKGVNQEIEVGLVHPKMMSEMASSSSVVLAHHESHGHDHDDHHAHLPPLRRLLRMLRPERREIVLLLVFAVFSGILYLALPLVVDQVVTNLAFGTQTQPFYQALIVLCQMLAACLLLQALIIGFQYYVAELIQRRIFVRVASDLSFRLPRVVAKAFDSMHAPELMNRFLDTATVQKNTALFLLDGINVLVATVIGLLLLALYHSFLMIFVVVLIVLMVIFIWPNARKSADTAIAESVCKYRVVAWFEEVATYPFMFKGRGGYEMAYGRTNELATDYLNARRAHFRLVMRQIIGLLLVSVLASVALLVIGVLLVLRQELTLGQLVASEIIMGSIVASIIKLGKKLETWYDTLAATDKVGHLLDLETESEDGETVPIENQAAGMRIEAKGVSFGYHGHDPLFENLSFKLSPGMRACICGAQGSGVSSLLDLCFALRETTAGYMSFDGLDMRAWDLEELRNSMELLRADEFVSGTVIENLRLGRGEITLDEIHNALKTVGLLDTCLKHPRGLEMPMQVGGSPFPPYQRAALLVARALVQKPRLLLIDEIFDGLDDQSLKRLTEIVFDRARPWTVVVASRMPEVREMCELWIRL